jgi:hypothetical protein
MLIIRLFFDGACKPEQAKFQYLDIKSIYGCCACRKSNPEDGRDEP